MTTARPIRDRLAEVLRKLQRGHHRPTWDELHEDQRENWRNHGDHLVRLAEGAGLDITDRRRG